MTNKNTAVPVTKQMEGEIVQELEKPYKAPLWVYLVIALGIAGIVAILLH